MTLTKLRTKVLKLLCEHSFFSGYKIITEYPGAIRTLPVKQPILVIGIDRVELTAGAMGGYFGEIENYVPTGPYTEITLRFDFLLPHSLDFPADLAEELFSCLFAPLSAEKLWCDTISHDKAAMANRQRFFLSLTALLNSQNTDDDTSVSDIIIRKV